MSAQGLPAHILALFTPRPPPQHLPPQVDRPNVKLSGAAEFIENFSTEKAPNRDDWESPAERKARQHREKMQAHKDSIKEFLAKYEPHKDPNASGDPFRTLFVARLSYDTTEKKLKREFEVFGSIKKARMIYDQKGKPRGYAFIEFDHERDLKNSYKQGDGKKIDGRRVMVDVERGRTVEGWLPRRLGGGRGPGRQGKLSKKKRKMQDAEKKAKEEKERGDRDNRPKDEKPKERKDERKDDRKDTRRDDKDKKRERSRSRDRGRERERERRR
jgi:U1 small nuclear ribonucleoprotein